MSSEKSPRNTLASNLPAEQRPRLQLSSVQILASALAAVTATIAGSFLGVNGTVIGAAVASVLTVTANAIYAHSLRRTGERVRSSVPAVRVRTSRSGAFTDAAFTDGAFTDGAFTDGAFMDAAVTQPLPAQPAARRQLAGTPTAPSRSGYTWRRLGVATAALFVCVLTLLTGVELVTGRPVSDLLRGTTGSGTTVFGAAGGDSARTATPREQPPVTVTRTVLPSVLVTTPTVTQTAPAVTVTPTPTPTTSTTGGTSAPNGSASSGPTP